MPPNYYEYMVSPAWREKRAQRLEIDGRRCRTCGATADDYPLQVHHRTYARLGHEELDDLITLCSQCHEAITNVMRARRYADRHIEVEFIEVVTSFSARVEVNYGMGNAAVSVDFISSPADAQRANGKPSQQVGEIDETDFIKARQDRR